MAALSSALVLERRGGLAHAPLVVGRVSRCALHVAGAEGAPRYELTVVDASSTAALAFAVRAEAIGSTGRERVRILLERTL